MSPTSTPTVALVTGAGSGIGRAVAVRLAADGHVVVVADIDDDAAGGTLDAIRGAGGEGAAVHLDVSSSAAVDAAVDALLDAWGRLDVVVNNAGVLDNMGPVDEITDADWARVLGVNLTGAFNVARRSIAPLKIAGGNIVNIASIGGLAGGRAGAAYTVSKHGVIGLTKSIAWMYAEAGIRCNAVCPGQVATNIGQSLSGSSDAGLVRLGGVLATAVRIGSPDEIAEIVAFLASPAASLLNGAIVTADAGWMAG